MIVESTRFGPLDLPDDRIIDFGPGLLGFPESGSYCVVEIEGDADYFWFQSTDVPELAFLATRPWDFFPDYEIDVPEETLTQIGLDDPADSEVFLLLTVQREGDESTAITANLLGPVVVNTETHRARQLVLDNTRYGTREPLVSA